MKPFDVFFWQPAAWPEPHPCVVISHPTRASNKDPVEVLVCSTKRAGRSAEAHEMILDEADGLDGPTLCKCDVIYAAPRSELKRFRGSVSVPRRAPLIRRVIAAHGWPEVLAS